MKLYVIRHGESETNKAHCWTGWMDVSLTETGKRDAENARRVLSEIKFDKIYASDLKRAGQTAQIALPGHLFEVTEKLREINVGSLSGKPSASIAGEIRRHVSRYGFARYGGESKKQFRGRVADFLSMVEAGGSQTVAAFAHAGIIREMMDQTVGARLSRDAIRCANCAIAVFDHDGERWRLHSLINQF